MAVARRRLPEGDVAVLAAAVCVGFAVVSVFVVPSLPSTNPFAWITWGREFAQYVGGVHGSVVLQGGPSWKQLPIVFTTVFGFLARLRWRCG